MSAEGSVRVSAVPIPRVEIVQAGVYALLDIDMRPIVGDILSYSNCVIAVAGADDIIDIIYKNYHVYSNKFKMALINVRIGYDENIAVRVRVGYMNPRQYNWILKNVAWVLEIPDDKWTLLWQGADYGEVRMDSDVGITFDLERGGGIAVEVVPLAGRYLHIYMNFISDLITRVRR